MILYSRTQSQKMQNNVVQFNEARHVYCDGGKQMSCSYKAFETKPSFRGNKVAFSNNKVVAFHMSSIISLNNNKKRPS